MNRGILTSKLEPKPFKKKRSKQMYPQTDFFNHAVLRAKENCSQDGAGEVDGNQSESVSKFEFFEGVDSILNDYEDPIAYRKSLNWWGWICYISRMSIFNFRFMYWFIAGRFPKKLVDFLENKFSKQGSN